MRDSWRRDGNILSPRDRRRKKIQGMADPFSSPDEARTCLHGAGWSIGETATAGGWLVTGLPSFQQALYETFADLRQEQSTPRGSLPVSLAVLTVFSGRAALAPSRPKGARSASGRKVISLQCP